MSEESQCHTVVSSTHHEYRPHRARRDSDLDGTIAASHVEKLHEGLSPPAPVFDTGYNAWMTIVGTFLIQFCTYGYVSAFGVYQDFYTRGFLSGETPSNISWIGSFQLFMSYAPGVLVGRAFDAGYFRLMISVGGFLLVVSMFMLSLAKEGQYYQVFLAQAVGMGLGQALLFLPSIIVIGHHFRRRRALATGIAVSGASVGGIIWPILLNQLSQRTTFPNAIRATAALTGGLLLVANLIMKTQPRPSSASAPAKPNFRVILLDAPYMVSIAAAFCISLGLFFPYFYLQLYAMDKGVNAELAFYVVAILNAGSVLGRLLPNFFADKLGPYNMLIPCLAISSVLAFSIFGLHSFAGIAIFAALYGFWSGSYVSLIPSLLAQLCLHPGEQGTRMGIAFSAVGIAFLVGTPIEGALLHSIDGTFIWWRPIIFCGVCSYLSIPPLPWFANSCINHLDIANLHLALDDCRTFRSLSITLPVVDSASVLDHWVSLTSLWV
ncbi:MFS general substrate transporter [Pluteus cervinus]|uniref:MFS general substrate transporter n=1 Tax=Pluteus cervinus TaxID=181527 RepID=A0ACD3AZZ8_9AGAR|nr:MFS general substrate transporter [Pluteus cervinus]